MMGHYGEHGFGGFWGFGIVWMFIILILVISVIYAVISFARSTKSRSPSLPEQNNALNILGERYARGEITEEEYKQMKKNLIE